MGNLQILHQGYQALAGSSEIVRGGLAGLEIAADRVDPDLVLTPENSDFNYFTLVKAGPYLSAADKFGSPAYSESELTGAPERSRVAADKVLAAALPIALRPMTAAPGRGCATFVGTGPAAPIVSLPPGGASLNAPPGLQASLGLSRYAGESFPVDPGPLRGNERLIIPTDRSSRPWRLRVDTTRPVTVCRA
jgi:hypothetical protein